MTKYRIALATVVALGGTATAGPYKAIASRGQMSITPTQLTVMAYKAEDKAELITTRVTAQTTFDADPELNEGTALTARFGMSFDPDNILLAAFSQIIPPATVELPDSMRTSYHISASITSSFAMPAGSSRFGGWCSQTNVSYVVQGYIWAVLDEVQVVGTGAMHVSAPLELVVKCLDKRPVLPKLDPSRTSVLSRRKLTFTLRKP